MLLHQTACIRTAQQYAGPQRYPSEALGWRQQAATHKILYCLFHSVHYVLNSTFTLDNISLKNGRKRERILWKSVSTKHRYQCGPIHCNHLYSTLSTQSFQQHPHVSLLFIGGRGCFSSICIPNGESKTQRVNC